MNLKTEIWEYVKSIISDGKSLIGIALSVVLGVLGWFVGPWVKPGTQAHLYITLGVAAVCLAVVTFRAWKKQRDAIDQLLTLKNAPKVFLNYETTQQPMGSEDDDFSIRCTDKDAVNIAFDPCELAGKRITFRPIAQMLVNESYSINCQGASGDPQFGPLHCPPFRDLLATACRKDGKSEMSVKIRITYGDGAGQEFETISTITYKAQEGTTETKLDGPKLVQ